MSVKLRGVLAREVTLPFSFLSFLSIEILLCWEHFPFYKNRLTLSSWEITGRQDSCFPWVWGGT